MRRRARCSRSRTRRRFSACVPISDFLFRILANCLDITSVWSIGHHPEAPYEAPRTLLAFADKATLQRLRTDLGLPLSHPRELPRHHVGVVDRPPSRGAI